jgi:hypothetical protein
VNDQAMLHSQDSKYSIRVKEDGILVGDTFETEYLDYGASNQFSIELDQGLYDENINLSFEIENNNPLAIYLDNPENYFKMDYYDIEQINQQYAYLNNDQLININSERESNISHKFTTPNSTITTVQPVEYIDGELKSETFVIENLTNGYTEYPEPISTLAKFNLDTDYPDTKLNVNNATIRFNDGTSLDIDVEVVQNNNE